MSEKEKSMAVTKKQVKFEKEKEWKQIFTILMVSLNGLLGGALFAWPSPTVPILLEETKDTYKMTMSELSYLAVIPAITTVVASPFVGSIIDILGRKKAQLSILISYSIALILNAIGGPLYIYYLARVADGIGDACLFSALPSYIAEIATPKVRGRWGNSMAISMYLGQFSMNTIGSHFSITNASYIFMAVPAWFLLTYPLLPESPYWLIMNERIEDARKSLQWLRSKENVEEELAQLIADVKRQQSETGRYIDLWIIPSNRKAAFVVATTRWIQNFSGAAAIAVYIQTIFQKSGSDLPANYCSMIYNASCCTCSLIASTILDKLGRRWALILSLCSCSLVLFAQGAVFYINDETDLELSGFSVLPLILMVGYVISFSIGLGIVPTMLLSEMFSSSIKSKAFVLMNINMGLSCGMAAQVFALLLEYLGLYAIFWFYAVCSLISVFISYLIVPETKGKTLEEIQQQFKK